MIYERVQSNKCSNGRGASSGAAGAIIASSVNWSFVAGAGTVLFAWYMQERRRRHRAAQGGDWQDWLEDNGHKDLQLTECYGRSSSLSSCIYLDYNGTTPIYPEVLEAMMPYLTKHFGNPSSGHIHGQEPSRAMNSARLQILTLLGHPATYPSSIWFTACGSEADNMAIAVALRANAAKFAARTDGKLPHVVTSNVEHPAIEAYLEYLASSHNLAQRPLINVTYVPVQANGRVKASDMIAAIRTDNDETVLVTLMLANNETGALQPVHQVAQYCRQHGVLFHTDAAQAAGKVSVDLHDALGDADMVTLVGHKLGAPKGVACLYVRPGCENEAGRSLSSTSFSGIMLHGGGQEFGRRAGTPNVPYIVGFGKAAEQAARHWPQNAKHMAAVRAYLVEQLQEGLAPSPTQQSGNDDDAAKTPVVVVKANGPVEAHYRLPNTLSVGLKGIHSGQLLQAVSHQVAASAGATCHGTNEVSAVLKAMGVPVEFARGTLRLSVGPTTTFAQAERAAQILVKQCRMLIQNQK